MLAHKAQRHVLRDHLQTPECKSARKKPQADESEVNNSGKEDHVGKDDERKGNDDHQEDDEPEEDDER